MSIKYSNVKKCFVPMCSSSSKSTPNKLFTAVPMDLEIRESWFKNVFKTFSNTATNPISCCEDHFNFDNDVTEEGINFQQKTFSVKVDVSPHILQCQDDYRQALLQPEPMEKLKSDEPTAQESSDSSKRLTRLVIKTPEKLMKRRESDSDISLSSLSTISSVSSTGLDSPIGTSLDDITDMLFKCS